MRARRTGADNYSVHLKASVVQLFQYSLGFKVAILMVKRVEIQRVYFALPRRGNSNNNFYWAVPFWYCRVSENFSNSIAFLTILLSVKRRLSIIMSKQDLQIYLKWKSDLIIYF